MYNIIHVTHKKDQIKSPTEITSLLVIDANNPQRDLVPGTWVTSGFS